jgi:hypothetical protein
MRNGDRMIDIRLTRVALLFAVRFTGDGIRIAHQFLAACHPIGTAVRLALVEFQTRNQLIGDRAMGKLGIWTQRRLRRGTGTAR